MTPRLQTEPQKGWSCLIPPEGDGVGWLCCQESRDSDVSPLRCRCLLAAHGEVAQSTTGAWSSGERPRLETQLQGCHRTQGKKSVKQESSPRQRLKTQETEVPGLGPRAPLFRGWRQKEELA